MAAGVALVVACAAVASVRQWVSQGPFHAGADLNEPAPSAADMTTFCLLKMHTRQERSGHAEMRRRFSLLDIGNELASNLLWLPSRTTPHEKWAAGNSKQHTSAEDRGTRLSRQVSPDRFVMAKMSTWLDCHQSLKYFYTTSGDARSRAALPAAETVATEIRYRVGTN
jgi:hypothetical protein